MTHRPSPNVLLAAVALCAVLVAAGVACGGGSDDSGKTPGAATSTAIASTRAAATASRATGGTPGTAAPSGTTGARTPGVGTTATNGTPGAETAAPRTPVRLPTEVGPTPAIVAGKPNTLAIDADAMTAETLDASARRVVGTTFVVGVSVVTPVGEQQAFAGLELQLSSSDLSVLAIDTRNGDTGLRPSAANPLGCGPASEVVSGPAGNAHITCIANAGTITYAGQGWLVDVTCVAAGTARLHLVRGVAASTQGDGDVVEDAVFGTQLYQSSTKMIPVSLQDAEITCE